MYLFHSERFPPAIARNGSGKFPSGITREYSSPASASQSPPPSVGPGAPSCFPLPSSSSIHVAHRLPSYTVFVAFTLYLPAAISPECARARRSRITSSRIIMRIYHAVAAFLFWAQNFHIVRFKHYVIHMTAPK